MLLLSFARAKLVLATALAAVAAHASIIAPSV
jgi:hypothetical protein